QSELVLCPKSLSKLRLGRKPKRNWWVVGVSLWKRRETTWLTKRKAASERKWPFCFLRVFQINHV
ncbi:MAG: hypothetical protein ACKVIA_03325, partial [Rhodobacterales bacterium]